MYIRSTSDLRAAKRRNDIVLLSSLVMFCTTLCLCIIFITKVIFNGVLNYLDREAGSSIFRILEISFNIFYNYIRVAMSDLLLQFNST